MSEAGCWAREQRHSIRPFVGWVCEKFFENKIICNSNKDRFRPKSGLLRHLKRVVISAEARGRVAVGITSIK